MVDLGISFETVKSLLIFFAPVLIPRAINLIRGLRQRVAISRRLPRRPLPPSTSQALNVFFFSISFFFLLSLPFNPRAPSPDIFSLTGSRLNTPTDVIFNRLARFRPQQTLTATDILLKSKFMSVGARKVYLRFGPDALTSCQFCSKNNLVTYLLYYIPLNTLLPHLLHMFILGMTTSASVAGREAAGWRNKFTVAGLALVAIDLCIVATYDPVESASSAVKTGRIPPSSLYYQISLLRPLAFAVFDSVCASLIYLSATNRIAFLASPMTQADKVDQAASVTLSSLTGASAKLHAISVTRNTVVRDKALKDRDDAYWRTVVSMDGDPNRAMMAPGSIWEEEEVVRAMSRAMAGQGGVDLAKLGISANEYVDGVTAGLQNTAIPPNCTKIKQK